MAESQRAVYAAIAGNTAVTTTKLVAALFTGSASMLSEAIHSAVDTVDGLLLLLGRKRSRMPPDERHPFGHGQELYFWTLIVSLIVFAGGGGVSVYEGILHAINPVKPEAPFWNYLVLGAAFIFDGASFAVGVHQYRAEYGSQSIWDAMRASKDPTLFTVLFEDTSDLAGLIVAFLGILLTDHFGNPIFDAIGSILIGLILMSVAILLARESKALLTGESAGGPMLESIRAIVQRDPAVVRAKPPLTMHFGPDDILLAMDIQFRDTLSAGDVAAAIDRIERAIRTAHPKVKHIFVEAGCFAHPGTPENRI